MISAATGLLYLTIASPSPAIPVRTPLQTVHFPSHAAGIAISARALFRPVFDHVPVEITIDNTTGRAREWRFELISDPYGGSRRVSIHRIAVADNQTRTIEIAAPFSQHLRLLVDGYGYGTAAGEFSVVETYPGVSSEARATTAMSTTLTKGGEPADTYLPPAALSIDPAVLPGDWRAWSGVADLWLTAEDWRGLAPVARAGILDWVDTGGRVVVVHPQGATVGSPGAATPRSVESGPGFAIHAGQQGLGTLVSFARSSGEIDGEQALRAVNQAGPGDLRRPNSDWGTADGVPPIEPRSALLALFLIAYASGIGPLNLALICRGGNRTRLLWSIPSIALGASVLLALVILLQDGTGGSGVRTTVVLLDSERNRAILTQEQSSRSGALLRTSFSLQEPVLIEQCQKPQGKERRYRLSSDSAEYHGDWFASRSIQAQWIETVRPSRARVELVSVDGSPQIVTTIDEPLTELTYHDLRGDYWCGSNVVAGQRVRLEPCPTQSLPGVWLGADHRFSSRMQARLVALATHRDSFFATADPGRSRAPVATLTSISWQDEIFYTGPVVHSHEDTP